MCSASATYILYKFQKRLEEIIAVASIIVIYIIYISITSIIIYLLLFSHESYHRCRKTTMAWSNMPENGIHIPYGKCMIRFI